MLRYVPRLGALSVEQRRERRALSRREPHVGNGLRVRRFRFRFRRRRVLRGRHELVRLAGAAVRLRL